MKRQLSGQVSGKSPGRTRINPALPTLALLLGLAAAGPALAGSKALRVTGVAAGAGVVNITIESFSKPDLHDPVSTSAGERVGSRDPGTKGTASPTSLVVVPVPNGSTALNTGNLIVSGINASLGPAFNAHIVIPGDPTFVQVDVATGTFTMTISENVPVQTIVVLEPYPSPLMAPWGIMLLGGVVLAVGFLGIRRSEGRRAA